jgi:methyl coenzyme M reductase gamma subunit
MTQNDPSDSDSGDLPAKYPIVTPHMVRSRTVELAITAGRSSIEIRQSDYERAKRELTGETDFDRQQAVLYGGPWHEFSILK